MNRMGETMSHIANPYKRSSQTLDADRKAFAQGFGDGDADGKQGLREQAAFCCLPSRLRYACMLRICNIYRQSIPIAAV